MGSVLPHAPDRRRTTRYAGCGGIGALGAAAAAPRPACFLSKTFPGAASRPAGKSPGLSRHSAIGATADAFPRTPFSASARNINAYIVFYIAACGRPARTDRVWAADVCGCYDRGRVPAGVVIPVFAYRRLLRTTPYLSVPLRKMSDRSDKSDRSKGAVVIPKSLAGCGCEQFF